MQLAITCDNVDQNHCIHLASQSHNGFPVIQDPTKSTIDCITKLFGNHDVIANPSLCNVSGLSIYGYFDIKESTNS